MNQWSVLLADDEPNARNYLARLISEDERFKLMGSMGNGLEVLQYCRTHVPDILLLDIEMPGMNGIETAKKLVEQNSSCVIIFVTAFDHYAIAAFDLMAIGYLLKPYVKQDLSKVLDRAIENLINQEKLRFSDRIEQLWDHYQNPQQAYLEYIEVKDKGITTKVTVKDILYIQSDSEYIRIQTQTGMHMKRQSLSLITTQLPPSFRQIHRAVIINLDQVQNRKYLNNRTYRFSFKDKGDVKSSRAYQGQIQAWYGLLK